MHFMKSPSSHLLELDEMLHLSVPYLGYSILRVNISVRNPGSALYLTEDMFYLHTLKVFS